MLPDGFIVIRENVQCVICGKDTRFVEVHFEAPLHPGVCADAMWWEYDDANRQLGPPAGW